MSLLINDLPQEIRIEIFTFLSLKHLGTTLSINKSIKQQIEQSANFWQQLANNYSKLFNLEAQNNLLIIDQQSFDEEKLLLLKDKLRNFTIQKQNLVRQLAATIEEYEASIRKFTADKEMIASYAQSMSLSQNSDSMITMLNVQVGQVENKINKIKETLLATNQRFKNMEMD